MKIIQIVLIIFSAHLLGSAILFGCISGPKAILAAPILSLFGWFFLIPEALGVVLIYKYYEPSMDRNWRRVFKYAVVIGFIGALAATGFVPKETNNETAFRIGGGLAGMGAAIFSFTAIHFIKRSEILKRNMGE